jgi:miniconductance mechanosensitive channel
LVNMIKNWLINYGINESMSLYLSNVIAIITIIIICMLANAAVKKFLMRAVKAYVAKSKNKWDDIILEKKVLQQIVGIVPGIIVYAFAPAFPAYESWIQRIASVYIVIIVLFAVHKLLNAIDDIYRKSQGEKARPIKGYLQVIEIIMFIIGIILIISFIINRSPWIMLSGIGAATAIGSLIFKDSILGLVASVQLTANDMVKLGDWIEMPSFGADGDVIDITLHTVKVQNWNKTISTIPTQALINQSFKNWSGMQESGGRRIKRHIYIDMNSIRFCTEEMLERFSKNPSLKEYMDNKKKDNGQLTNLGVFRAYLIEYLKNHPKLNKKMTMMVRQLQPTEKGLPIELYVFTDGTAWVNYEMIQWDIFEHIFAVLHEFDLRVYQSPSGYDLVNLRQ